MHPLDDFFCQSDDGFFVWSDPSSTRPEFVSPSVKQLVGYAAEDFLSGRIVFEELIHEADKAVRQEKLVHLCRTGSTASVNLRYALKHADGRWIRVSDHVYANVSGDQPLRLSSHLRNVEEHIRLEETSERLSLVVEGTRLGMWDWNPQTNEVVFDERWARMLGHELSEIPFELASWESRVHPEDLASCYADLAAHINGEQKYYENVHRMRHKDGSWRYILDRGRIVTRDVDGNPTRFSGTHTDITPQKEAELKAQAADEAKSRFLAVMSHEIRTPLHGMLGLLELIAQDQRLTTLHRDILDDVQQSGGSLLDLLNDLLDYSRAEVGQLTLENKPFNATKAVQNVVRMFQELRSSGDLQVTCRSTLSASDWRVGDERRVRQVLSNLLSNAVKFTARGTVTVIVDGTEDTLEIAVRDSGPGMPETPDVWHPFVQGDDSARRPHSGAGLGLSIVREFVGLMGGTVSVSAREDAPGSVFTVKLPLLRYRGVVDAEPQCSAFTPLPPARVLVAEDNAINQRIVRAMLEAWGVSYEIVENGEAVIEAVTESEFDVVLMDVHMSPMDGLTAVSRLRQNEDDTPVIAVTADTSVTVRDACKGLGISQFIAKPFRAKTLRAALDVILSSPET